MDTFDCSTFIIKYYKFIKVNPDKYLDDFIKNIHFNIDCNIPSEK